MFWLFCGDSAGQRDVTIVLKILGGARTPLEFMDRHLGFTLACDGFLKTDNGDVSMVGYFFVVMEKLVV